MTKQKWANTIELVLCEVCVEKQKCGCCGKKEYIPTHQYVKFDGIIYYLCGACWDIFRAWFFRGQRSS
ncbi:MAG: hypothetical protein A3A16_00970 [Candidatus Harrisonbacteria bacterium RIFCSPLOWO2_01_FULL_44_18]|uniref:Uncharacterized protein n=1 Tax=Candidatus Harrisonbacteria bacterium RIFCSPLOWO2_01_FULL_44_18 TaxID=1798407 RepID=A0A1G1ZMV9_9BACT|nr:MAG: hypothetical protein A3A16_00970 [Candidatus Harrisonbacteria bacterium RIFCSPLOWO2_01_FULL_44_18]